jgi:hypothetical protein
MSEIREKVHRLKAVVGKRGYIMIGSYKITKARIIEIVGLSTNSNQ